MRAKSLQSCLTRCDSMDCSLPGSSVHGDSPGKNTGVGCHALLQGIFLTQGSNPLSLLSPALAGRFSTTSAAWEARLTVYHRRLTTAACALQQGFVVYPFHIIACTCSPQPPNLGFSSLARRTLRVQTSLCSGAILCIALSIILWSLPLDASSTPSSVAAAENVHRHCQMSPRVREHPA